MAQWLHTVEAGLLEKHQLSTNMCLLKREKERNEQGMMETVVPFLTRNNLRKLVLFFKLSFREMF